MKKIIAIVVVSVLCISFATHFAIKMSSFNIEIPLTALMRLNDVYDCGNDVDTIAKNLKFKSADGFYYKTIDFSNGNGSFCYRFLLYPPQTINGDGLKNYQDVFLYQIEERRPQGLKTFFLDYSVVSRVCDIYSDKFHMMIIEENYYNSDVEWIKDLTQGTVLCVDENQLKEKGE